jgi:hypothetical protein
MANTTLQQTTNFFHKEIRTAGFLCFQGSLREKVATTPLYLNTDTVITPEA